MTSTRIRNAQKEIQHDLQAKPQYVLDTSEFHDVKARLDMLQNRHDLEKTWANLPVLKKRVPTHTDTDDTSAPDDNTHPTLKRK